jgi:hypothetical protein
MVKLLNFRSLVNLPPTYALCPINPNNAYPSRFTAAAGTKLARIFF